MMFDKNCCLSFDFAKFKRVHNSPYVTSWGYFGETITVYVDVIRNPSLFRLPNYKTIVCTLGDHSEAENRPLIYERKEWDSEDYCADTERRARIDYQKGNMTHEQCEEFLGLFTWMHSKYCKKYLR